MEMLEILSYNLQVNKIQTVRKELPRKRVDLLYIGYNKDSKFLT